MNLESYISNNVVHLKREGIYIITLTDRPVKSHVNPENIYLCYDWLANNAKDLPKYAKVAIIAREADKDVYSDYYPNAKRYLIDKFTILFNPNE